MGIAVLLYAILIGIGYLIYKYLRERCYGIKISSAIGVLAVGLGIIAAVVLTPALLISIAYDLGGMEAGDTVAGIAFVLVIVGTIIFIYVTVGGQFSSGSIFREAARKVNAMTPTEEELEETRKNWPLGYLYEKTGGYGSKGLREEDIRAWRNVKANRMAAEETISRGRVTGAYRDECDMLLNMYPDLAPLAARKLAEKHGFLHEYETLEREAFAKARDLSPSEEELAEFASVRYKNGTADVTHERLLRHYRDFEAYKELKHLLFTRCLTVYGVGDCLSALSKFDSRL